MKKGLDAVWSFAEIVKHKEGVANAIFDLYGTDIHDEIYRKYCNGYLSKNIC